MQSDKTNKIFNFFESLYGPNPRCELNYSNDIQLLVAIILSAQCTDKRVNIVTKDLFKKYTTVADYANAKQSELEQLIYSTGFYRNKAKNIISMANAVVTCHNGRIPGDLEQLTNLAGVGRKTASVFLAEYYNKPALAVDTHVGRVARRLGYTTSKNPVIIERDLAKAFDQNNWARYHLYMVLFGRYICKSQNPSCNQCRVKKFCTKPDTCNA